MVGTKLQERGIYELPDGRRYVVCVSGTGAYSLYRTQDWARFGPAEYRIHADGRILSKGTPTRWRAEDLTYTGRIASPPQSYRPPSGAQN